MSREDRLRREGEQLKTEGIAAIAGLDDLARPCKAKLPDVVAHAIAHAVTMLTMDGHWDSPTHRVEAGCFVCRQLYRAGYHAGQQHTETLLKVNSG